MSTQPQFESESTLTALYCVKMIHQLFQGRACTNTILVKLCYKQCIYASLVQKTPLVQKTEFRKRPSLQFLKDDDLEMR